MKISTHLCFDGQCEEAFRFYQQVLGGTITTLLRYGEAPLAQPAAADMRDKILHATLVIDGQELLGADIASSDYRVPAGYFVTMSVPDPEQAAQAFRALSSGGEICMPLQRTFWSAGFGVLVDRFGIPWEVQCDSAAASAHAGHTAQDQQHRLNATGDA